MTTYEDKRFYELADLEGEEWKDVEGFEGLYKVSNMGRVKSLERTAVLKKIHTRFIRERILSPCKDQRGYLMVPLMKNGGKKTCRIATLVGVYFVPNPENKETINHKKGIKIDNRASELEWATNRENFDHAVDSGLMNFSHKGEAHGCSKITEEQARKIKYEHNGLTNKTLSEIYGLTPAGVRFIRSGRTWKHI